MTGCSASRLAFVFALTLSSPALADAKPAAASGATAIAEELFDRGQKALRANQLTVACELFEASFKAEESVGAMLNLALCHEKQNKSATAWAEYRRAAKLAYSRQELERSAQIEDVAAKLEQKLSRLWVEVPKKVAGLSVKVDGTELPPVSFGVGVPVDPGERRVQASARGYQPWSTTVSVKPEGDTVSVTVPELQKAVGRRKAQLIAGAVVGGAGVLTLVGGIVAGVRAIGIRNALRSDPGCIAGGDGGFHCDTTVPETKSNLDALPRTANIATGLFIAGGVLTATGIVVLATAPKEGADTALRIGPTGATLTGSF